MHAQANPLKYGAILLIAAIVVLSGLNTRAYGTGEAATDSIGTRAFAPCPPINDTTGRVVTAQAGGTSSPAATPSGTGGPGYLGAQVAAADSCGVLVLGTLPDSPATGQLKIGDVIVAIDCVPLTSTAVFDMATRAAPSTDTPNAVPTNCSNVQTTPAREGMATGAGNADGPTILSTFFLMLDLHQAGDRILLTLDRDNQEMNIAVTLGAVPEGAMPFAATSASTQQSTGSTAGGAGGSASGSGTGASAFSLPTTAPLTSPTAPGLAGAGAGGSASGSGAGASAFSQPTAVLPGLLTPAGSGGGSAAGGGGAGSVPLPVPPPTTVPVTSPISAGPGAAPSPTVPSTTAVPLASPTSTISGVTSGK